MKRSYQIVILCLLTAVAANAQIAENRVDINQISVVRKDGQVYVSFKATVDKKAVKRNYALAFAPFLTDGEYRVSLPVVVVEGKGARISRRRADWASGISSSYRDVVYTRNNTRVDYSAAVPFQDWMRGADLKVESMLYGCCTDQEFAETTLTYDSGEQDTPTGELRTEIVPEPAEKIPAEPARTPQTIADTLSTAFAFVLPYSAYDETEPFRMYDDERENSLVVYFKAAKFEIDPAYMGNELTLGNLISVIDMIRSSDNSAIKRVIIAGFSSPEGSYEQNDRFAFERAVSVKEYIMLKTGVSDGLIKVHNGSVDWRGLRAMIAQSNLPEKRQIVDIIDNTPIWDSKNKKGRLGELMRLNNGRTYRYLLEEYFPYLRNGAFIKVFYENKMQNGY